VYLVWNAAEAMENVVSSKEFGVPETGVKD
jgi:hypothetical protein